MTVDEATSLRNGLTRALRPADLNRRRCQVAWKKIKEANYKVRACSAIKMGRGPFGDHFITIIGSKGKRRKSLTLFVEEFIGMLPRKDQEKAREVFKN